MLNFCRCCSISTIRLLYYANMYIVTKVFRLNFIAPPRREMLAGLVVFASEQGAGSFIAENKILYCGEQNSPPQ